MDSLLNSSFSLSTSQVFSLYDLLSIFGGFITSIFFFIFSFYFIFKFLYFLLTSIIKIKIFKKYEMYL